MAIKIKPSNIFDIGNPNNTSFVMDEAVLRSRKYEKAQGLLSNTISATLYEAQYNSSGVIMGFTDVRTTAQENFEGTLDISSSTLTNFTMKFSINKIANFDTYGYFSIRETVTYGYVGGGTWERTLFLENVGTLGNDNEVTFSRSISQNGNAYPTRVSWVVDGVYARNLDDEEESLKLSQRASRGTFNFPRNELVQESNLFGMYSSLSDQRVEYNGMFLDEVFSRYSKTKRVISLLLEVGKYYDTDGNLVVDAESSDESIPPLIRKHEIIEPYRMANFGETPIETTANGEAQQFEVIAVNFSYSGISRQEIIARAI